MKFLRYLLLFLLIPVLYFLFYPVPINPTKWEAPKAPELTGPYEQNNKLDALHYLYKGQCHACEDIAIDTSGRIYGGSVEGEIIRFDTKGNREVFAVTGGRPLGLDFDKAGNLIVADADKGLLSIDPGGKITVLSTEYGGVPFKFTDDLEVADDGVIYFSDASHKFGIHDFTLDLLEHGPNGRLLSYNPAVRTTTLLMDSLYFANGIAVAHDQSFVLVNETGKYWVRKFYLKGPKAGQSEILIDNLPGFPDGVSQGTNGVFWVALVSPRDPALDDALAIPFARKILMRLPPSARPAAQAYGFVLGIDKDGNVLYNLQDPTPSYREITSVQEHKGRLYLGSLFENGIATFEL